jgi:transcriptional regulator with XRE-family HTH domain
MQHERQANMEYSERILQIMQSKGITPYRLAKETGMTESLFSVWKTNPSSKIYAENLVKVADYLGCSVDYLLGRTDNPEVNR